MRIGDRVRVNGHPSRFPWMDDFVSKRGRIAEVNEKDGHKVYGVKGLLSDGDLAWFGASYLELAGEEVA